MQIRERLDKGEQISHPFLSPSSLAINSSYSLSHFLSLALAAKKPRRRGAKDLLRRVTGKVCQLLVFLFSAFPPLHPPPPPFLLYSLSLSQTQYNFLGFFFLLSLVWWWMIGREEKTITLHWILGEKPQIWGFSVPFSNSSLSLCEFSLSDNQTWEILLSLYWLSLSSHCASGLEYKERKGRKKRS